MVSEHTMRVGVGGGGCYNEWKQSLTYFFTAIVGPLGLYSGRGGVHYRGIFEFEIWGGGAYFRGGLAIGIFGYIFYDGWGGVGWF